MKAKLKRQVNGLTGWIMLIVALIVGVGIGGLFINGNFANVVILKLLPLIVHTVTGWIIVVTSFIPLVNKFL